jgi:hypothetical protein
MLDWGQVKNGVNFRRNLNLKHVQFLVFPEVLFGLQAYAKGSKLSIYEVLKVGISLANALECLHKAGLIHKDVSGGPTILTTAPAFAMPL